MCKFVVLAAATLLAAPVRGDDPLGDPSVAFDINSKQSSKSLKDVVELAHVDELVCKTKDVVCVGHAYAYAQCGGHEAGRERKETAGYKSLAGGHTRNVSCGSFYVEAAGAALNCSDLAVCLSRWRVDSNSALQADSMRAGDYEKLEPSFDLEALVQLLPETKTGKASGRVIRLLTRQDDLDIALQRKELAEAEAAKLQRELQKAAEKADFEEKVAAKADEVFAAKFEEAQNKLDTELAAKKAQLGKTVDSNAVESKLDAEREKLVSKLKAKEEALLAKKAAASEKLAVKQQATLEKLEKKNLAKLTKDSRAVAALQEKHERNREKLASKAEKEKAAMLKKLEKQAAKEAKKLAKTENQIDKPSVWSKLKAKFSRGSKGGSVDDAVDVGDGVTPEVADEQQTDEAQPEILMDADEEEAGSKSKKGLGGFLSKLRGGKKSKAAEFSRGSKGGSVDDAVDVGDGVTPEGADEQQTNEAQPEIHIDVDQDEAGSKSKKSLGGFLSKLRVGKKSKSPGPVSLQRYSVRDAVADGDFHSASPAA